MIRKPTEKEFRESVAVMALRETKRTAVKSGNGLGQALRVVARLWLYGTFWFAVLAAAIPAMLSGRFFGGFVLIVGAYVFQVVFQKVAAKTSTAGVHRLKYEPNR